jgi:mannose-6-phosphate isomerase-like protein (cupin superfamily)
MLDIEEPRTQSEEFPGVVNIEASDADFSAMQALLRRGVRVGNENSDVDLHLRELIPKPWGHEYRIYADDFLDIWHLQINPGHATSMHAHPRKTTYLLCLLGNGITRTLSGVTAVAPGIVLRIARGAFHTTENAGTAGPLMLVEVEVPRNKYDLVRLRDGYERVGKGYEEKPEPVPLGHKRIAYLPNARMCRTSPCGTFAFDILSGTDVHYRRHTAGVYLVPLGMSEILTERMTILTDRPADRRSPDLDSYYLAIRSVA